ncbi:MAG: response regulator [Candidatus Thermoplasmatota archaeon]|nr:response regulator [Candidatus Thermoplasmatota archaeon]
MDQGSEPERWGSPLNVLLVEDEQADRLLLERLLGEVLGAGAEVTPAATLSEARRHLERGAPDLILLDLNLPDSTGVATVRAILEAHEDLPVVVLTGLPGQHVGQEAVAAGAQDFIPKEGLDPNLLSRAIHYAILRHEARARLRTELEASREELAELIVRAQGPGLPSTRTHLSLEPRKGVPPAQMDLASQRFAALLEDAVEEAIYDVQKGVSRQLLGLADDLAAWHASPADVLHITREALSLAGPFDGPAEERWFRKEGRLRSFELMGHLVSAYRRHALAWGVDAAARASPPREEGP